MASALPALCLDRDAIAVNIDLTAHTPPPQIGVAFNPPPALPVPDLDGILMPVAPISTPT